MQDPISVSAFVAVSPEQAWTLWCDPEHITRWNAASADWHTPQARVDLRAGGQWFARMEARDGSMGFDLVARIDDLHAPEWIRYTLEDGRAWGVRLSPENGGTRITEQFEAEHENPRELQEQGWQLTLNNFKKHAEARSREKQLRFEIGIEASPLQVCERMIAEESYRKWTAEFNPTSRYQGTWSEGSRMLFLGEDGNGKIGGMVSRIRKYRPGQFISIEHLGLVQDGKEITEGPEVEPWAGALENYYFESSGQGTHLTVTLETNADFESYMQSTWPKALQSLKAICEAYL